MGGILLAVASGAEVSGSWTRIRVPGAWEMQGPAAFRHYDGFAWYRAWVKPHDTIFAPHERNLFQESVTINLRDVADVHEVFLNGKRLGGAGSFPPSFQSGRAGNHRYKVPAGTLSKGTWNEIAIRVFNRDGPGGFLSEAPFLMDYFHECRFEGEWEIRQGDHPSWVGPALLTKPSLAAFEQFHESRGVLGESTNLVHGLRLTPEESARRFKAESGWVFEPMLAEPLVAQPTHFSFDEKGRLWIAQYRQYPYPAGLKMLSRDKYYRAQYDKIPPPPPGHDRGRDRITWHEDTDGDGLLDRHGIFVDGLNLANAVVTGRGGVWVMHTPYLIYYPDADSDGVPDGPPVVHLSGFGLEDTHSIANGLVWGMDGWLYGGQGSTTTSRVVRPGLDPPGSPGVYYEGCMVWRYHPSTRAYEVFAEGSGNTFGLEVDGAGRLYSGHNGGETRGWHYLQGGFYLKQGKDPGKFGPSRNPYTFGELPRIKPRSAVTRFSHLFAVGEGTAIPQRARGKWFSVDPLHGLVVRSESFARGSTFETEDEGPVVSSSDEGFRPVFIANGADGAIYVADFYEQYIAHGQHYQSQIDPTTGRIYRLRGADARLEPRIDLGKSSSSVLVSMLAHSNKWHRQTAVRVLGEQKNSSVVPELLRRLREGSGVGTVESFWALNQMDALTDAVVLEALDHRDPLVRLWAVRFAGDLWGKITGLGLPGTNARTSPFPRDLALAMERRVGVEADAEVRSQWAATSRRLPVNHALRIARALLIRDEDAEDPFIPLMVWWILEQAVGMDVGAVVSMFDDAALWRSKMVRDGIVPRLVRRLLMEGRGQDLLACAHLLEVAPDEACRARWLEGFEEASRGRPLGPIPEELGRALARVTQLPLRFRLRQGDAQALEEALGRVTDPAAPLGERAGLIQVLGERKEAAAVPVLLKLVLTSNSAEARRFALASLAGFDQEEIGETLLAHFPSFPLELRTSALAALTSRSRWTERLVQSLEQGKTLPSAIPAEIVDKLGRIENSDLRTRALRLFSKAGPRDRATSRAEWIKSELSLGTGDAYRGSEIYAQRCATCHKLFHKGGKTGPDLTSYQRDNLDTLLASILDPSAEIREGFLGMEVETRDGRSLTGFMVESDRAVLVLRGLDGADIVLDQREVIERKPLGRSLMPDGLLDDLDGQAMRDFFAFLRSTQPFAK